MDTTTSETMTAARADEVYGPVVARATDGLTSRIMTEVRHDGQRRLTAWQVVVTLRVKVDDCLVPVGVDVRDAARTFLWETWLDV